MQAINVGVGFVCKGPPGSQVVMDDQGGPRAGDQVFALRQVVEKTIEKALVTCTHFSMFSIKITVIVITLLLKSCCYAILQTSLICYG